MAKKKKNSIRYRIFASRTKSLIFLFIAITVFLIPIVVFAQTQVVRTKVGNPKEADLVRVAKDLKNAYDVCNNGYTWDPDGNLSSCLREQLNSMGYDKNAQNLFEQTRLQTLASQEKEARACTQCLGFVRLAITLTTGDPEVLRYGSAAQVARLQSFTAQNGQTWVKRPPGEQPEPGDIGAHANSEFGHIFIIWQVDGAPFKAIESNGRYPTVACKVTNDIPRAHYEGDGIVFFKKM